MATIHRKAIRAKVRRRIRKKISGTAERPRLAVHFSNQNVYAQLIDDEVGRTLAAASTRQLGRAGANVGNATEVGKAIAEKAKGLNIGQAVFDRGGFRYHGKVAALADAVRESGITV